MKRLENSFCSKKHYTSNSYKAPTLSKWKTKSRQPVILRSPTTSHIYQSFGFYTFDELPLTPVAPVETEPDLFSLSKPLPTPTFNKLLLGISNSRSSACIVDHTEPSLICTLCLPLLGTLPTTSGILDGFLPITCRANGLNIGILAHMTPKLVSSVVQTAKLNESHCASLGLRKRYATDMRVNEAQASKRPRVRTKARPSFWGLGRVILRMCGRTRRMSQTSVVVWRMAEAVIMG